MDIKTTFEDKIYSDINQKAVLFVKNEEATEMLANPIYRPILGTLREGIKTAEEITHDISSKEEDQDISSKSPSLKTVYRHLKALTEAGLVVEAGTRTIYREDEKKTTTKQTLFARTAKFFYFQRAAEDYLRSKDLSRRAKYLKKILEIYFPKSNPTDKNVEELLKKISEVRANLQTDLFKTYPDELVEALGEINLDDLQYVFDLFLTVSMMFNSSDFEKEINECLKQ